MEKKGDMHSREVMKSKGLLLVVTVEDVTLCTQKGCIGKSARANPQRYCWWF